MFKKLHVITQTYKQKNLTKIAIKSFEKFKPKGLEINYIVVEGSSDVSYKKEIEEINKNVKWFNNAAAEFSDPVGRASTANGMNIEFAKSKVSKLSEDEWIFVCHNDIAVQSGNFFKVLFEYSKTHQLISCCRDNIRINACHISGLLVKNKILQKVDCTHDLPRIDVGDRLTEYCRENEIKYISLPNTHNSKEVFQNISGVWSDVGENCGVDRCVYENEVIFCHLGRGTPKSLNRYTKLGKITVSGWEKIHQQYLR